MLATLQQQFLNFWKRQSLARQITLVALLLSVLILVPVLFSWATTPSYAVAYSGLSEADAAQIVKMMDDNSISYKLKDTGTITVPSDQVYSARLLMARNGLPQSSTVGYELFSGTAMLGMTEFSQKINYQRAIEGELERTIGSLEAVKAVRVHLVTPEKSLLTSAQALSTASVTLQVRAGYTLEDSQVRSITHLVASSVEGLKAQSVVVVDSDGNMLADGTSSDSAAGPSMKDTQRAVEKAYGLEVQKRVQTILDKILGPSRSVVQATVEMDWTQREVTSNSYAPTEIALRSSQIINEVSNSAGTNGGVPGATSNLPTPVPTTVGTGASAYQRNEETLNYEVSQVQSHEVVAPGKVTRVSVSVMVDGITDDVQMESIKAAVQAAAGMDTARGDQVIVESFAFDRTAADALAAELARQQQQELYMQIGMSVGAAIVVLALLFFILRMITNMRNASKESWKTVLRPASEMAALQQDRFGQMQQSPTFPQVGFPQSPGGAMPAALAALSASQAAKSEEEDVVVQISSRIPHSASEDEQRSRIITRLTEENPATVAEIIQIWLKEGKK